MYWKKQTDTVTQQSRLFGTPIRYIGYILDGLSNVVAPAVKKEFVISVQAEVTGYPRDAAEGKWTLGGEIEVPCIYRLYGSKKTKVEFRNKLRK